MHIRRGAVLVAIGLLVGGTVWAQSESGDSSGKKQELDKIAESERSLVDEDIDSLSGQQKLDRGQKKIEQCKKNLETTNKLLQKARKEEQDIRKINCINDKQAAIKGFLKVAEQSYVKLKTAVSGNDTEEAKHHYTLISVSKQKIDKLTEEARLCAGEVQRYAKGTKADLSVDDDISDPPEFVPEEGEGLVTLPDLTPFQ